MGILPSNPQIAKIGMSDTKIKEIAVSLLGNKKYTIKATMAQAPVNTRGGILFLNL
jgi:hypothetical protein